MSFDGAAKPLRSDRDAGVMGALSGGGWASRATIHRERLIALTDPFPPGAVTLVRAPAGYGKTVLLQQWIDRLRQGGKHPVLLPLTHIRGDADRIAVGDHGFKLATVGSAQLDIRSLVHPPDSHTRALQGIPKRIEVSDLDH